MLADIPQGRDLMDHPVHANLTNNAVASLEAPVTEFCFFMFPKDASEEDKSALEDAFLHLPNLALSRGGATAYAIGKSEPKRMSHTGLLNDHTCLSGWTLEGWKQEQASDREAISLQFLVGWPSMEDHKRLQDSGEFEEAVRNIKGIALPPLLRSNVFHVKLQSI